MSEASEQARIEPDFWRNKRVLLTGHTGFIGPWLALALRQLGARVTGYGRAPEPNPFSLWDDLSLSEIDSHIGELDEPGAIAAILAASRPELVFHLAAQALVGRAERDQLANLSTNVMGTARLLDGLDNTGSARVAVIFTSDKVYAPSMQSHRESDPLGGEGPYGASKAAAECVIQGWRRSLAACHCRLSIVRAGNVFGGGDWAEDRLVPDTVRAFHANRAVALRSPHSVRPWQHVVEPVRAALILAQHGGAHQPVAWNIGPTRSSHALTAAQLVEALAERWPGSPSPPWLDRSERPRYYEAPYLAIDSTQAQQMLGWRPVFSIAKALQHTAAWYVARQNGADMRAFTVRQLIEADPAFETVA